MRHLLAFLLCAFFFVGNAQNYQPINSHSLQVFYQNQNFSEAEPYNMWGTRIDSFSVTANSDTTFFNYPVYRDTSGLDYGVPRCVWVNAPNWTGLSVTVDTIGNAWFMNVDSSLIKLNYTAEIGETWNAYEFPNGDSLIAEVIDIEFIDDGWVSDSVKTIEFNRYAGVLVSDTINGFQLELYKTGGFRTAVDFVNFPYITEQLNRVNLDVINENAPKYALGAKYIDRPEVGDGYYYSDRTTVTHGINPTPCHSSYFESIQITDVQQIGNSVFEINYIKNYYSKSFGSIWGTSCSWNENTQTIESDYASYPFSTTVVIDSSGFEPLFNQGLMPREKKAAYRYSNDTTSCIGETVYINGCWWPFEGQVNEDDSCTYADFRVAAPTFPCTYSESITYSPVFGVVREHIWDYNDANGDRTIQNKILNPFSIGSSPCGEYEMVSISEPVVDVEFRVYPNPANQTVAMSLSRIVGQYELIITDLAGREIMRIVDSDSQPEVNVSNWPNGVYLVNLISEQGTAVTEKLIVQH